MTITNEKVEAYLESFVINSCGESIDLFQNKLYLRRLENCCLAVAFILVSKLNIWVMALSKSIIFGTLSVVLLRTVKTHLNPEGEIYFRKRFTLTIVCI